MKRPIRQLLGGDERDIFGATVTFANEQGDRLTIARTTTRTYDAVRQACAIALRYDETYRVLCISTPETIHADLCGRALRHGRAPAPEVSMLSRIGMKHMLHPSLDRSDEMWTR